MSTSQKLIHFSPTVPQCTSYNLPEWVEKQRVLTDLKRMADDFGKWAKECQVTKPLTTTTYNSAEDLKLPASLVDFEEKLKAELKGPAKTNEPHCYLIVEVDDLTLTWTLVKPFLYQIHIPGTGIFSNWNKRLGYTVHTAQKTYTEQEKEKVLKEVVAASEVIATVEATSSSSSSSSSSSGSSSSSVASSTTGSVETSK